MCDKLIQRWHCVVCNNVYKIVTTEAQMCRIPCGIADTNYIYNDLEKHHKCGPCKAAEAAAAKAAAKK